MWQDTGVILVSFLGAGEGGVGSVGVGCVGEGVEGVDLYLSTFQVPRLDLEGMLQIGKERLTIARCSPSSPRYEGHIGGVGRVISWSGFCDLILVKGSTSDFRRQ